ncbi:MAG: glycoside hydrolase family 30 protein [Candidatus Cyclobacteriaceae bacterium M3_2C_046]
MKPKLLFSLFIFFMCNGLNAQTWISSTESASWQTQEFPKADKKAESPLIINITDKAQTIDGFGGAFSELGWQALQHLDEKQRKEVMQALFASEGADFSICRVPMGASDFALGWWSLNDTRGDYAMDNFSIARDKEYYIPYIKAAMAIKPDLQVWGSPWSPPSWMKDSDFFACKGENTWDDCCEDLSSSSYLTFTDQNQKAYALYFEKFIRAYRDQGINLYAIHVQNEPAACQLFPSCLWNGAQLRDFIKNYLGPHFEANDVDAEIWLGTINNDNFDAYAGTVLADPEAKKYIDGVGYQWAGKKAIGPNHQAYPEMKLMQTESECGNGLNTWEFAEYTFSLLKHYLDNGANSYLYWNMVLNEHAFSNWMWRQNSMVTVNTKEKTFHFNPEYYLMKHFAHFVPAGSQNINTGETELPIVAFARPDQKIVILINNNQDQSRQHSIQLENKTYTFSLDPHSFHTIVL